MRLLKLLAGLLLALGVVPESTAVASATGPTMPGVAAESRIFFSRQVEGDQGWSIFSVDARGENERVEVPYSSGMGEYNPTLNPDGRLLLFNTYRWGGWKLATQPVGGAEVVRWSEGSDYYTNGAYSPDGRYVAYEFTQRTGTDIQVRSLETGRTYNLTAGLGASDERVPSWTPDGRTVVYFTGVTGTQQINAQPASGGPPVNLSENEANDFSPAVSPDGTRIAFFSDRDGHADLFVMSMDGREQRNLSRSLQNDENEYAFDERSYWRFKASWSPDGTAIVFNSYRDGNHELFIVSPDGSDLRRLTRTEESEITPFWGMIQD